MRRIEVWNRWFRSPQTKNLMNRLSTTLRNALKLIAAAALGFGFLATAVAASEKGAERLQSLSKVTTFGDMENLKPGDKFAMVCAKCQTVMLHTVSKDKGRAVATITAQHNCSGCNSTITAIGHGKAKTDQVKHSCSGCGEGSVFCCSTAKGGKATDGMKMH